MMCPTCGGPLMSGEIALRFGHDARCTTRDAEDATLAADAGRAKQYDLPTFSRSATAAERSLLTALGVDLALDTRTRVTWVTDGVRQRSWEGVTL